MEQELLCLRVERAKRKAEATIEWIKARRSCADNFNHPSEVITLNILEGYITEILNDLEGEE